MRSGCPLTAFVVVIVQNSCGLSIDTLPAETRQVLYALTGVVCEYSQPEREHIAKMRADYNQYLNALR